MVVLYGLKTSRAFRSIWLAEEIGLDYEIQSVDLFESEHKQPDFLAINPLGQVPAMADGDFSMGESLAINLYIADRYGDALAAQTPEESGMIYQWTLWVATSVEPLLMPIIHNRIIMPSDQRDEAAVAAAIDRLAVPLSVLDGIIGDREFLLGDRFTVADLNVASVLSMLKIAQIDTEHFGHNVSSWLNRCLSRPACDYEMQRTEVTPEMLARLMARQEGAQQSS